MDGAKSREKIWILTFNKWFFFFPHCHSEQRNYVETVGPSILSWESTVTSSDFWELIKLRVRSFSQALEVLQAVLVPQFMYSHWITVLKSTRACVKTVWYNRQQHNSQRTVTQMNGDSALGLLSLDMGSWQTFHFIEPFPQQRSSHTQCILWNISMVSAL